MSVIFSSNITLNTIAADFANRPRILVDNVFQLGTVTASSENGAANGWLENAVDGGTYDWWEWTSTPAWLEVTLTTALTVDMCAIGLHTGITFVFQYWDGSAWVDLHDAVATTTTAVHAVIFAEVTASKFRIYISAAQDESILGIVMLGKSLQFPKTFYGGHAPITINRTTQIVRNKTEAGFDAGVYSLRTGAATGVEITNVRPGWIRDNLEDLNKQLEIRPFVFAWRPGDYPDDVAYCWLNSPITASNSGPRDLMSLQFDVNAFVGFNQLINNDSQIIFLGVTTDEKVKLTDLEYNTLDFIGANEYPNNTVFDGTFNQVLITVSEQSNFTLPNCRCYKIENDEIIYQSTITNSGIVMRNCELSNNGNYLILSAATNGARLRIYEKQNTNPITFSLISTDNTDALTGLNLNDEGNLLATICRNSTTSNILRVYSFDETNGSIGLIASYTFAGQPYLTGVKWINSNYIVVNFQSGADQIMGLKFNGSAITLDYSVGGASQVSTYARTLALHPQKDLIVNCSQSPTKLAVYTYDGATLNYEIGAVDIQPDITPLNCNWVNGKLIVNSGAESYIYSRVGNNLTLENTLLGLSVNFLTVEIK
jgi:hypothetical protein